MSSEETGIPHSNQAESDTQRQAAGLTAWANRPTNGVQGSNNRDVVDAGIISMATARQLFETYRNDLCPHYPMVPVPDSITAEQMRQTRPTLFLAMVAAAAGIPTNDCLFLNDILTIL